MWQFILGLFIGANVSLFLYAIITVLSNKKGYCYASNNYLGKLYK